MNIPTNLPTKAISLWQPFGFLIANGHKPVENRPKRCHLRERILIHAGLHFHQEQFNAFILGIGDKFPEIDLPLDMPRGGIIGVMTIYDCVDKSDSPWFTGPFGWLVKDCQPLPFRPCKGKQGFFNVDYYKLPEAA